jgi:hypothetical protein
MAMRRTCKDIVNVSSGVGKMPQPFASAYVISKYGIVALSDCLRQELWDMPDIHVVTVLPPATDTPLFQQAGNYMGRAAEPMWPIYNPETIARAIVSAALAPRGYRGRQHPGGDRRLANRARPVRSMGRSGGRSEALSRPRRSADIGQSVRAHAGIRLCARRLDNALEKAARFLDGAGRGVGDGCGFRIRRIRKAAAMKSRGFRNRADGIEHSPAGREMLMSSTSK